MTHEKLLIVNADDYGLTREVSRGIRHAHLNGIVTSTTAMMNMEGVLGDLKEAVLETPKLGIGVHLILTAGSPVLPISEVSSLVDNNGQFPKIRMFYEALPRMNLDHVYKEWKTQIEKMRDSGIQADHLDSHHHVSYLDRTLFQIMLSLASEFSIPIRHIPSQWTSGLIGTVPKNLYDYQAQTQVQSPINLETRFYGEDVGYQLLNTILHTLNHGSNEMMTHPGFVDDILRIKSSYSANRGVELAILGSKQSKSLADELDIKLTTFKSM